MCVCTCSCVHAYTCEGQRSPLTALQLCPYVWGGKCVPCCLGTSLLHTQLAPRIHYCMGLSSSVPGTEGESRRALRAPPPGQSGDRVRGRGWCRPFLPLNLPSDSPSSRLLGTTPSSWGHLLASHNHALPFRISEVMLDQTPSL